MAANYFLGLISAASTAGITTQCTGVSGSCRASVGEIVTMSSAQREACGQTAVSGNGECSKYLGPEFGFHASGTCAAGNGGVYANLQCIRNAHQASALNCCLNQATGNLSCDPSLTNGQSACDATLANYCGGVSNPFTDSNCQAWITGRPTQSAAVVQAYCTTAAGIANPNCQSWCNGQAGLCDVAASSYCAAAGKGSNFCSCINSTTPQPQCFDTTCTTDGYKTSAMKTGAACGTLIQCVQNWAVAGGSNAVSQNQAIQNCGQGMQAPTTTVTAPTTTGSGSTSATTTSTPTTTTPSAPATASTPATTTSTAATSTNTTLPTTVTSDPLAIVSGLDDTELIIIIIVALLLIVVAGFTIAHLSASSSAYPMMPLGYPPGYGQMSYGQSGPYG